MLIIGGGPISVEMAQSFGRFGCRVTVVEMLDRILPREDPSVSAAIKSILEKEGVHCLVLSEVEKLELKSNSIAVSINSNSSVTVQDFESVFVSIGRKPNIEKLNLKKAGVTYSRKGIDINTFLQTSIPHIYACGDVASPYQFTHTAGYQADIAAHNAVHGNNMENDFSVVPWVIFSDPEIARVGMTEEEARNKYGNIQVLQVNADSVDRPKTEGKTTGFVKIILDESDQIVGAHAVGERSGEYIHEIALVMKYKLGIKAVAQLIHAYPTYSEIVRKAAVRYLRTKETV
jgi:pyruvate/2-oxoglutarate dehydrogenase complex dihydrolipoamide dehydrogenase (E3) component